MVPSGSSAKSAPTGQRSTKSCSAFRERPTTPARITGSSTMAVSGLLDKHSPRWSEVGLNYRCTSWRRVSWPTTPTGPDRRAGCSTPPRCSWTSRASTDPSARSIAAAAASCQVAAVNSHTGGETTVPDAAPPPRADQPPPKAIEHPDEDTTPAQAASPTRTPSAIDTASASIDRQQRGVRGQPARVQPAWRQ